MPHFADWLSHRMELVGYVSSVHFCRAANLHRSRLESLQACASPRDVLGERDLFRFAPLLRTSVRQLRRLVDGQIPWIDDDHWMGSAAPIWRAEETDAMDALITESDPPRTAAIGRITPAGEVDLEEHWDSDHGPWLPCRVGSGKGTFALRVLPFDPEHRLERWALFRFVPHDRLPEEQDVALFVRTDAAPVGLFGRLTVIGEAVVLRLQDQRRTMMEINPAQIMQLARVVGSWPEGKGWRMEDGEWSRRGEDGG